MKIRIVSVIIFLTMLLSFATATSNTVFAKPMSSSVHIDGVQKNFSAYSIGGANYFKLRDLAMALRETDKKFEVSWDSVQGRIVLTQNKAYTPIGGELAIITNAKECMAQLSQHKVFLSDKPLVLDAYNIGGANYFKLRDVMQALGVTVIWNAEKNLIELSTKEINKPENEKPDLNEMEFLKLGEELVGLVGSDENNNVAGQGLGFVIAKDGKILTTFDVIKRAKNVDAYYQKDGKKYKVNGILAYSVEQNLALLDSDIISQNPLQLGKSSDMKVGDVLDSFIRINRNPKLLSGKLTSLDGVSNNDYIKGWISDLKLDKKNWGAPVCDKKGNVVGVGFTRLNINSEICVITPIDSVFKWMNKTEIQTFTDLFRQNYPLAGTKSSDEILQLLQKKYMKFEAKRRTITVEKLLMSQSKEYANTMEYGILIKDYDDGDFLIDGIINNNQEIIKGIKNYCRDILDTSCNYFADFEHMGSIYVKQISSFEPTDSEHIFSKEYIQGSGKWSYIQEIFWFEKTDIGGLRTPF